MQAVVRIKFLKCAWNLVWSLMIEEDEGRWGQSSLLTPLNGKSAILDGIFDDLTMAKYSWKWTDTFVLVHLIWCCISVETCIMVSTAPPSSKMHILVPTIFLHTQHLAMIWSCFGCGHWTPNLFIAVVATDFVWYSQILVETLSSTWQTYLF